MNITLLVGWGKTDNRDLGPNYYYSGHRLKPSRKRCNQSVTDIYHQPDHKPGDDEEDDEQEG